MDRRPRGKNDRARRERGRGGNFAKLSSSSLRRRRRAPHAAPPVLRERAARRREKCNAFMHSDTAAAAGEGRRAERRTGGGGARRRSLFCPLPPPSLSFFAAAVQKLAEVFVPAGAPRCGRTDADARCVCLAGAADDRVRVLHFVRRQTGDGPDPSARPTARPTQACKILDRRGGRRRRLRLLSCRSVFAELARCCSLSSLQRVRRKSLFLSHPFLALLTRCDAIHYLSESYHSLGGPLRVRGSLDPSHKIPRLSPVSRRGGNGSGRTLYSTLLHIAALGGYESTVFAKRSPRAEFSVSHRRRRCHCSCTFARTSSPLTTESERVRQRSMTD